MLSTFALLPLLFLPQRVAVQPPRSIEPDILIIVADDLGWRDIDASVPTPNLDRLAEQGMTYRRAYSFPYCSPTRYSLVFGQYPFREGLGTFISSHVQSDLSIPVDRLSLPALLKTRGYRTLLAGKWHLNTAAVGVLDEAPRLFGFENFQAGRLGNIGGTLTYRAWQRVDDGVSAFSFDYNTQAITDAAIAWWQQTDSPKLAKVAYHTPHAPFHLPPVELLPPGYSLGPGIRGLYEAMVVSMDTEIGRLLEHVDRSRTWILFLGDNGTPEPAVAADQDFRRVKGSVYEGGVNVPFLLAGPGVTQGGVSDALISTTDVFATFCDALDLPVPPGRARDSVSFRATWDDPDARSLRKWVFTQSFSPNGPGAQKDYNRKAIIASRFKLLVEDGFETVFDLGRDPGELYPLDTSGMGNRRILGALRDRLERVERQGAP